jgi:hypothetical protein
MDYFVRFFLPLILSSNILYILYSIQNIRIRKDICDYKIHYFESAVSLIRLTKMNLCPIFYVLISENNLLPSSAVQNKFSEHTMFFSKFSNHLIGTASL